MTTTYGEQTKCALCGTVAMYDYLGSTNSMGPSDLDWRSAEMERSTMGFWLHVCSKCRYVATRVSVEIANAKEIVESEDYKSQLNREGYPKLANLFLCQAMIQRHAGQLGDSGMACLYAAWVCDDGGLVDDAIQCRKTAAHDIQHAIRLKQLPAAGGYVEIVLVDILRRSKQFDDAGILCIETLAGKKREELVLKILEFQRDLIEKKDTECYTMGDVENESSNC